MCFPVRLCGGQKQDIWSLPYLHELVPEKRKTLLYETGREG